MDLAGTMQGMCGIAGIIGRVDDANRAALARISAAMRHRGPDGEGAWESPADANGRGVLLAHRRLAILDLSPAGAQPMVDPVTGHVIAFNGEIYNYLDLRTGLPGEGRSISSSGDTAVLLRVLALRGAAALPDVRGMFALACWDPGARRLLLARDPLGIKPLYVARNPEPGGGWSVAFASELRALLASGLLGTPRLDARAVGSVIWNGFVVGPSTAVEGVELLGPGERVEFDARGVVTGSGPFWCIPDRQPGPPVTEAELDTLVQEDVRLHLASDVPLAVFLSGGVDSSAMASLASRVARGPVHTFTMAFEEQELNEGPIARRVAAAIGTRHTEVVLTEDEFVTHLDAAIDGLDQPTFDGLNAYFMSRAIRAAGFKVAIAGAGGDELFGGYSSFRDLPVLRRWAGGVPGALGGLLVAVARAGTWALRRSGGEVAPQTRWAKLPDMVRDAGDLLWLYQLAYALFLPAFQDEVLAPDVAGTLHAGLTREMEARLRAETARRSPRSAISVMELRLFLGERLLRDNDVASMAVSLEQRVPLVDSVLFEAVDRLPDDVRYLPPGRKEVLRRIGLRGLDPALFDRPKRGFVMPFDRWIRQGLREAMDGTLRDPEAVAAAGLRPEAVTRLWRSFLAGAPGMYWSRVWAIYVLVRWCQRNGVRR
jgi:asparagine synthase (glutamine-hydrolysing)